MRRNVVVLGLALAAWGPAFDVLAGLHYSDEFSRDSLSSLCGALDLALLCFVVYSSPRERWSAARVSLAVSLVFSLAYNATFVGANGIRHFVIGIGAEQILSRYLGLLALRVLILMSIGQPLKTASSKET